VLRLVYLKHRYQLGYESLCREVTDSISWRQFRPIPLDWPDNDHWTLDRVATVIERLTGSAIIAVTCGSCCATGCIIACCVLPAAPSSVTSGPSPSGWPRTGLESKPTQSVVGPRSCSGTKVAPQCCR
jgi:hypothetical protein